MEFISYFLAAAKGASEITAIVLGSYLLVGAILSIYTWARNRSGGSGFFGHIDDNRRIDGPDGS